LSLAWTPDGTRLLSAGDTSDPTIREWDTSTWEQVGHPWEGHTDYINAIAIHPAGTLITSASHDGHVCLWRLSDRRTIAIFQPSSIPKCVTFSVDGKHILSGGEDNKSSEWALPSDANSQILVITTARDACLTGDLSTAEELLTQEIDTDADSYISYANRSFVMARKRDWDHALDDAIKSISIQPSLTGYISKGIALYGKGHVREAIVLFNAAQHEEAMLLVNELAAACPNANALGCHVVETYLRVQLGINVFDGARHDEAADHFTTAVNSTAFSSKIIHLIYEDLIVLFGWDLHSLLLTTHQKRCQAFLSAGKPDKALEAHKYMMEALDETAKASCLNWSNEFKERCSALAAHDDRILGVEIPGQDHDGYDTEPNFFHEMHQYPHISRPRPQQRPGRLKRLKLAMKRTSRSAHPPVPPTTPLPVPVATTFKTHLRHLFNWTTRHATPPFVNVPFAQGRQRNAAAGAPGSDHSLIRDEDYHGPPSPDPNTQQQQQQQPVTVQVDTGEHGGGRSCCCC
jgi:thiamine pyrophosphokinase